MDAMFEPILDRVANRGAKDARGEPAYHVAEEINDGEAEDDDPT